MEFKSTRRLYKFFDSDDIAYDNHGTASEILNENNYDIIHLGHHKILNKKIIKKIIPQVF